MFDLESAIGAWRDRLARAGGLTRAQLDELEDHLRTECETLVARGVEGSEAWARARDRVGAAEALAAEFRKVESTAWRRTLRFGWAIFVLAYFLPVHEYGISLLDFDLQEGLLPGFQALLVAVGGDAGIVGVLSGLTNLLMLASMWRIGDRSLRTVSALAGAAAAAALLNTWWLVTADTLTELRVGYFLWWGSFGVVAVGLALRAFALAARAKAAVAT